MEKQSWQHELRDRTIADFGEQWTCYTESEGHYGSTALLADVFGPLLTIDELADKQVVEIGSGNGRIVRVLLDAGAKRIVAIEPSKAVEVLRLNFGELADRVEVLHCRGEDMPVSLQVDYVVSIGVIHHVPEPQPVMAASFRALLPGGRMVIWVYGAEGNRLAVGAIKSIRSATIHLPHVVLAMLAHLANLLLDVYLALCRWLPLPLRDYMRHVIGKFNRSTRHLVIYDQLKPAYARYYTEAEVRSLFVEAGFVDIRLHNRHNYSWTVIGTRPTT